jgi:hypothetical protein
MPAHSRSLLLGLAALISGCSSYYPLSRPSLEQRLPSLPADQAVQLLNNRDFPADTPLYLVSTATIQTRQGIDVASRALRWGQKRGYSHVLVAQKRRQRRLSHYEFDTLGAARQTAVYAQSLRLGLIGFIRPAQVQGRLVKRVELYHADSAQALATGHFSWRQQVQSVEGNRQAWRQFARLQPFIFRRARGPGWKEKRGAKLHQKIHHLAGGKLDLHYQIERYTSEMEDRQTQEKFQIASYQKSGGMLQFPAQIFDNYNRILCRIKYPMDEHPHRDSAIYRPTAKTGPIPAWRVRIHYYRPVDLPRSWQVRAHDKITAALPIPQLSLNP